MREASLPELLNSAISWHLSNMNTAQPCVVLRYYPDEQRVDVQPVINQKDRDGESLQCSPILNVQLMYQSSRTSAFTFPIQQNDIVLCIFSQRSLDVFKSSSDGLPQAPNDYRKFSLRDAIAIPGLFPFKTAINNPRKRNYPHSTNDAVITHNIGTSSEVEIRLKPDGTMILNSPIKLEVNTPSVVVNTDIALVNANTVDVVATTTTVDGDAHVTGDVTVDGDVIVSGISFLGHTHPGVAPGGSSTGTPQ